jgi:hypothetical protein
MNQKYKRIILIISAVVLLILALAVYRYVEPTSVVDQTITEPSEATHETPQEVKDTLQQDQVIEDTPVGYKAYTNKATGVSFNYPNLWRFREITSSIIGFKPPTDVYERASVIFSPLENYDEYGPYMAYKKILTQSTFLGECPPEIAGDLQEKRHDKCVVTTIGKSNIRAIERWDEDIEGTPEDQARIMEKTYTFFVNDFRVLFTIEVETFMESLNNFTNPEYINFSFEPYQTGSSMDTNPEKLKALQQFDDMIASISL